MKKEEYKSFCLRFLKERKLITRYMYLLQKSLDDPIVRPRKSNTCYFEGLIEWLVQSNDKRRFIVWSFSWGKTKEGYHYWVQVNRDFNDRLDAYIKKRTENYSSPFLIC